MANIGNSINYVLKNETGSDNPDESGYSNNPFDRGGPTAWGVTLKTLSIYRGHPCSPDEVKNLKKAEAVAIYKKMFWDPMGLDHIVDQNVATCIFDIEVNRGEHTAVIYSQYACNCYGAYLEIDGYIGPKTLEAINKLSREDFITAFYEEVIEGYRDIVKANANQAIFLHGWENRSERLLTLISDTGDLH